MFLRSEAGYELWGETHPGSLGCLFEGRDICAHKYHIVDDAHTEIFSFDNYLDAEEKFVELTGGLKFAVGKTKWSDGKVILN